MAQIELRGVKNGLFFLKNVAEGALPEKMHQDPPDPKSAPDLKNIRSTDYFFETLPFTHLIRMASTHYSPIVVHRRRQEVKLHIRVWHLKNKSLTGSL
jgi:hypothetical protein